MSETLLLSYQYISWFIWHHQLWFLNFTVYSISAAPVPLPYVSHQPNSEGTVLQKSETFPETFSCYSDAIGNTKGPFILQEPGTCWSALFSLHSEAWRCEKNERKSREPPLPTEGHRRTGLEDLQNSILGRKGLFPFSAGYFGCFPTPEPEVPACIWHLFTGYPSLPSLPSHRQTRLLKITNESIHFYLDTWP